MIILDENIIESQRQLLKKWRIRVRQIGQDLGKQGLKDLNDVIPLLQSLRKPVLFTSDLRLFKKQLCHPRYGLVCLNVPDGETATYIWKFLRHAEFNTKAKRMGKVVRVGPSNIYLWALNKSKGFKCKWEK